MTESPGVLIGLSNVLTRRRERVPRAPEPDAAGLARLRTLSRRALEGREAFIHDGVLAGRRVRLFTNSHHLGDFWRDAFLLPTEWEGATGRPVPREPVLVLHAPVGVPGEPEGLHATAREVFLINTSYFADLRAATCEAFARLEEAGGAVVHGGAVDVGGRGCAWRYPREVIHPTPAWGLLERPGAKLVADGWMLVGADGRVQSLEKQLYVRTSVVAAYPAVAPKLLRCKFENVPMPSPPEMEALLPRAREVMEAALRADPRKTLSSLPEPRALEFVARLLADPNARFLCDPVQAFGRGRVAVATRPAVAFSLRAAGGEPLAAGAVEPFACPGFTLNVDAVPGHPREIVALMERAA